MISKWHPGTFTTSAHLVLLLKLLFLLALITAHNFIFRIFYHASLGGLLWPLALVPPALAGWLLGIPGGLLIVAVMGVANAIRMINVVGVYDPSTFLISFSGTMLVSTLVSLFTVYLKTQVIRNQQAQTALRLNQARHRLIVANMPVTLFALDRQGTITLIEGRGAAQMESGNLGKSVFAVYPHNPDFLANVRRGLAGETFSSPFEHGNLSFETHFTPIIAADGKIDGLIIVAVDTTQRKQAEEAYQTLVETSLQGLFIMQDLRIVFANPHLTTITGYTLGELLAMSPEHIMSKIHPEDRDAVRDRLQRRLRGESLPPGSQFRFIHKNGKTRWFETYSTIIEYQGKPAIQLAALDVTDQKQLDDTLTEARGLRSQLEKERELRELKGRFMATVTHEFRTPLAVIETSSYLLEQHFDKMSPERRVEHFDKIRVQVRHLNQMVDEILTVSRDEQGKTAFKPVVLDIERFCRLLTSEFQAATTRHTLNFMPFGDLQTIEADKKLLYHILGNLLSNAIKYSPDGGEISFEVHRQEDTVIFQVSDQGIGISADDQQRIFEPFHRGGNVKGISGTGLGLSIVKEYVELHGGAITCSSFEGEGTTFTVHLPISQGEIRASGGA